MWCAVFVASMTTLFVLLAIFVGVHKSCNLYLGSESERGSNLRMCCPATCTQVTPRLRKGPEDENLLPEKGCRVAAQKPCENLQVPQNEVVLINTAIDPKSSVCGQAFTRIVGKRKTPIVDCKIGGFLGRSQRTSSIVSKLIGSVNTRAFLGTNPLDEPITTGLLVIRNEIITRPPGQGPSQFTALTSSTSQR
jgi:hypothetical protein